MNQAKAGNSEAISVVYLFVWGRKNYIRDLKGFLFGVFIGQHFGIHLLSIVLVKKSTRMFQQTFHSGL